MKPEHHSHIKYILLLLFLLILLLILNPKGVFFAAECIMDYQLVLTIEVFLNHLNLIIIIVILNSFSKYG